jgi:hypothetical protein
MLRKAHWHSVKQTRTFLRRVVTTAALVVGLILVNPSLQSEAQQTTTQPEIATAIGFSCSPTQCTCTGPSDCYDLARVPGLCRAGLPKCGGGTCICDRQ